MVEVEPTSRLFIAGAFIVWMSLALVVLGLATPNWMEGHVGDMTFKLGLFQTCENGDCVTLPEFSSDVQAVQALLILGILCGLVAAGVSVWIFLLRIRRGVVYPKMHLNICLRICAAACVLILVGTFVYMGNVYGEVRGVAPTLGYSFIVSAFSCITFPVGGVLVFFGGKPPTKAKDIVEGAELGRHHSYNDGGNATEVGKAETRN